MNIVLENVTFTYPSGVTALRGVNLTIHSGEAVAIIGENGAGKTTLAKQLNGLLKPGEGRVHIGEWDTQAYTVAQLAGRVGYVFQNPDDQLFESTVWDEVAFGPRNLGCDEGEVKRRVAAALDQVQLAETARTHPYDLQISQRKRVALAAVLAMQTPIVIFDEPTTGQDSRGMALIEGIINALKQAGRTVLTISHDIDFCAEHFERVVAMADGQVLADGTAATVLAQEALLARTAVEPPQLARLATALALPGTPLTVAAFLDRLAAQQAAG